MENWRHKAAEMVYDQILPRGIGSASVVFAMKNVPRHLFVPDTYQKMAYSDRALPLNSGQTVSQPYMVARMTDLLQAEKGKRILEIGTGSGYQAAVLAETGADVISVERIEKLARSAERLLHSLGYNVKVIVGDGRRGYPDLGPYDGIIVTAACERIEKYWEEQLSPGGRIVLPLKVSEGMERLLVRERSASGTFLDSWYDYCHFVPVLKGIEKWDKNN